MADTDALTNDVLQNIALQVARRIGGFKATPPGAPGEVDEIAESFAVWTLSESAITGKAPQSVANAAVNTGTWHHQIKRVGTAPPGQAPKTSVIGAARSVPKGPGGADWNVEALNEVGPGSQLPVEIAAAAAWVEGNAPDNPVVRLLVIPSRYIHAFWLSYPGSDAFVVIDRPQLQRGLEYAKIYTAADFFQILGQSPPSEGVSTRLTK